MLIEYPLISPSPTTSVKWRDQLLPAEQRLLRFITFTFCKKALLVQYL